MQNGKGNKETKNVGPPMVVWVCPLCTYIYRTTDPRVVRMHCPGCCECSWMKWSEDNGGEEKK